MSTIVAVWLAKLLWKSFAGRKPVQSMIWATVLTWTLVLNIYVPIYDSVLLTIALIVMLGALRDLEWRSSEGWFAFLAIVIIAVSWITGPIAQSKRHSASNNLAFRTWLVADDTTASRNQLEYSSIGIAIMTAAA